MKTQKSIYSYSNYPLDAYKKFEFIPKKNLNNVSFNLANIIINNFNIYNIDNSVNILFAGSGYGRIETDFLKIFEKKCPNLKIKAQFIDISNIMIRDLQKNINNSNLRSEIRISRKDFNEYVSKEKYDIVFALFSLHLFGDRVKSFKKMKELMSENGLLILSEEIGDFLYMENNPSNRSINSNSEYGKFWKYFYKELEKPCKIYNCDLNFQECKNGFREIYKFDERWHVSNITYNDICRFIEGTEKIFGFFPYHKTNKTIIEKWLLQNKFSAKKFVRRFEGHRFFIIQKKHAKN